MQEAPDGCGFGELCQPRSTVRIDRQHRVAVFRPKRHEGREVHDAIDAAQGLRQHGFVFEAPFDPFVGNTCKLR